MFSSNDIYGSYQFNANLHKSGLFLKCLNDVYGVYTSSEDRENFGYRFKSYNVDNPVQQITILAGLGALHDKARKAWI